MAGEGCGGDTRNDVDVSYLNRSSSVNYFLRLSQGFELASCVWLQDFFPPQLDHSSDTYLYDIDNSVLQLYSPGPRAKEMKAAQKVGIS